jgi:hypothetical protein
MVGQIHYYTITLINSENKSTIVFFNPYLAFVNNTIFKYLLFSIN